MPQNDCRTPLVGRLTLRRFRRRRTGRGNGKEGGDYQEGRNVGRLGAFVRWESMAANSSGDSFGRENTEVGGQCVDTARIPYLRQLSSFDGNTSVVDAVGASFPVHDVRTPARQLRRTQFSTVQATPAATRLAIEGRSPLARRHSVADPRSDTGEFE